MGAIEKALESVFTSLLAGYNPLVVLAIVGLMGGLFFMTRKFFDALTKLDEVKAAAAAEIADLNKQLNAEIRSSAVREAEMSKRYDASVDLIKALFEARERS